MYFLNEKRRESTLRNDPQDEELFQNNLTEELTIVINLAATLGVPENKPPRKEPSGNRRRGNRKKSLGSN